jgi:glycopeptide antibiotics resistance protein
LEHKKKYLFLAISWTVFITYLSLANVHSLGVTLKIPNKDKIVHFVFYFVFYFLWYHSSFFNLSKNKKIILLIIAILYGIGIEILQAISENGRHADILDVMANTTGALIGYFLLKFISNKKTIKK